MSRQEEITGMVERALDAAQNNPMGKLSNNELARIIAMAVCDNLINTEGQAGDVGELRQNPEQMFKNFEDEGWNAKRERCEKAVMTAVTELMVGVMGGASKTVFEPEEGCPYRITIEYGEVQNGQFN